MDSDNQVALHRLWETTLALSADQRALIDGITDAGRLYERFLAKVERMLAGLSLGTVTERRALAELRLVPDLTDSELCRDLGIEKSQISRTLLGLERQGFIENHPAPRHKLQRLRRLSATGQQRAREIYEARSKAILFQYNFLSPEERAIIDEVSGLKFADVSRFAAGSTELRPFARDDWQWVFQTLATLGQGSEPADLARYTAGMAEFDKADLSFKMGWIALKNSQKVGVCLSAFADNSSRAEIPYCFVVRDARGIGVAQEMIGRCMESARHHTLSSISARVRNPSSMGIVLKRLGFTMDRVPARQEVGIKTLRRFKLNLDREGYD